MNTNLAWKIAGVGPQTRLVAEEAARRAGMRLEERLDEAVEQAAAEASAGAGDGDGEDDWSDAVEQRVERLDLVLERDVGHGQVVNDLGDERADIDQPPKRCKRV